MKTSIKFITICAIFFITNFAQSYTQTYDYRSSGVIFPNDTLPEPKNKIGASYSGISYYGLTYQRNVGKDIRLGVTSLIYLQDDNFSEYLDYGIGLQVQKILLKGYEKNAYVFFGAGIQQQTEEFIQGDFNNTSYKKTNDIITFGIGMGGSATLLENFTIDAELGYGYCNNKSNDSRSDNFNNSNSTRRIGVTFGIGLYFAF